jgi:hypothetical protein
MSFNTSTGAFSGTPNTIEDTLYQITATNATGSAFDTFSFTVVPKAAPSLSNFADLSKFVGDASFTLTAPTVANSLPGSFTYTSATTSTATISGATVTLGSAGTTVITATFTPTDTANYNNATIQMTLTVSRITQATLSITSLTTSTKAYPYEQALSITTSGGSGSGATTFAIASGGSASGCALSNSTATATITATTVGTCLIQATKAADATYDATTSAAATFTFTKAIQSITFTQPTNMTVGGTQTRTPAASSSLTVTLTSTTTGVCTVSGFVITAVGSGTCSISASQPGDDNYEAAAQVDQYFTISKGSQTVTFTAPANITYGDTPASLSATSTSGLVVAFQITGIGTSDICTVSGTTVTIKKAGTCAIVSKQEGNDNYLRATDVLRTFTIAKATPSLSSFGNLNKAIPSASFTLTAPTVANSLDGSFTYTSATTATATISGATVTLGNAGTTVITATFTPITTVNYNNATIQMTLSVSGPYNLGDTGPGGGRIFYKAETPFACGPSRAQTCTYLEAAPAGWNGNLSDPGVAWAQTTPNDYRSVSVGTTGTAIGWGYANTKAIIDQGNSNITNSAAALADSYSVTVAGIVYDDWYLPSLNELGAARDASFVRDGLDQNLYWSSSEFDANKAWYIWVINNVYSQDTKGFSHRVRPVRSF